MTLDTRTQLLDTAEGLFAERGFYGVSIAAIASELGLTKQALLHHFQSKEKLYGAVLERISDQLTTLKGVSTQSAKDPADALKSAFLTLHSWSCQSPARARLLMRELIDNQSRAKTVSTWYLKPFLEDLLARLKRLPNWAEVDDERGFAAIYQILGAISYYAVSGPTLQGVFGDAVCQNLDAVFPEQLALLIDAVLQGFHRSIRSA